METYPSQETHRHISSSNSRLSTAQEIFYFTNSGSTFKCEDATSESMAIKASEKGNRELVESLTGEGGPLQAGLLPAAPVNNEKALHEAFGETTNAIKTPKPKKSESTEKAEPKTFVQRGPPGFTRKNVYLQFSLVVLQTKSPYLTRKHSLLQQNQN